MLNTITVMGRLVRDPELRQTPSGVSVCNFTVASERDYNPQGEKTADFIDCIAWRQCADFITKYFSKGQPICVTGRLQTRDYEKDGQKRKITEVKVDSAYFCGGPAEKREAPREVKPVDVQASPFSEISDEDGDLPF